MHRQVQTCAQHPGMGFFWRPAPGVYPYCAFTDSQGATGLSSHDTPQWPPTCCPSERK